MSRDDVTRKALGLMAPVLGEARACELIDVLWTVEALGDVRALRRLLAAVPR
jgi:hypothetical protein